MLRRVHPRTVNPIPLGKQSWFDSKLLHQNPVTIFVKMAFDQRQRSGVQKTVRGVTQNLIGRISTAHRLRIKGDGQGNYSIKGLCGNKQLILFQVRSYNGHYLGLSIRRREFDSPTHRQSFYVSVTRKAREQIANLFYAGSIPVTHSKKHIYYSGQGGYHTGLISQVHRQFESVTRFHFFIPRNPSMVHGPDC